MSAKHRQNWLLFCAALFFCSFSASCIDTSKEATSSSPLSEKLKRAERVAVLLYADEPESSPRSLGRQAIDQLVGALADAVVDPDPSKWDVTGRLTVVTDGQSEEWLLGLYPHQEGRVRVSAGEYYRGLDSARVLSAIGGNLQ